MTLTKTVEDALKTSMLSKDTERTLVLRSIKAKLQEAVKNNKNQDLDLSAETKVLEKMIKDREKSVDAYLSGNRQDLADKETKEIELIKTFIPAKPEQLSEEEAKNIVNMIIKSNGFSSMKDMGKVMSEFNTQYPDMFDKKQLSLIVKELLS